MATWIVHLRLAEDLRGQMVEGELQEYYQRGDEKVQALYNRAYIYLSREEMDRFVDASVRRLFRIYQYQWVDRAATEAFASALDLIIEE